MNVESPVGCGEWEEAIFLVVHAVLVVEIDDHEFLDAVHGGSLGFFKFFSFCGA